MPSPRILLATQIAADKMGDSCDPELHTAWSVDCVADTPQVALLQFGCGHWGQHLCQAQN